MLDLDHLNSLHPPTAPLDRRAIVKASLTVGFCAAVAPVWAQVIQTSAEGLVAGEVRVPSSGADIPAYRAMPDRGGPFPAVLVIHEIFGVHEYIKDVCRRWAKLGYYAIAPDLYARQGDASKETDIARLMAEIVAKVPDAQVAGDLDATSVARRSPASAGAGAKPGCTPRIIPRSRRASPGTGRSPTSPIRSIRTIRPTSWPA